MSRLLLVSQPTVGGAAVQVAAIARYARDAGHTVSIACPSSGHLAEWGVAGGARHLPLEMTRNADMSELSRLRGLRRMIASSDLVHLHSSKAGALGRVALKTLGTGRPPSVFTPHGWSWLVGGRAEYLYKAIERSLAGVPDVIVAVSDWDAQEGFRVLGNGAKISTVHNGVDLGRYDPVGTVAEKSLSQLVLVVGRLTRAKGQDLALEAAALLSHMDVEFRFLGAGEEEASLRALASSLNLRNVSFCGEQDPAPHYRAADLLLVPSRWDACSLVVLEALACGTAVLASSGVGVAGAFPGQVHQMGSLEPARIAKDVQSLLLNDVERWRGIGDGIDVVRDLWSEERQMEETLAMYKHLLR